MLGFQIVEVDEQQAYTNMDYNYFYDKNRQPVKSFTKPFSGNRILERLRG